VAHALVLFEDYREGPPASDAGGVEHEDMVPSSSRCANVTDQPLEAWSVVILAAFHGIGVLVTDDGYAAPFGEFEQSATLGIDGDVGSIL
jgi:hypothetical protein